MIVIIEPFNAHEYSSLMEKMFRLRALIFRKRKKWDVEVVDGKERDKYDDLGPVYIIYTDDGAKEVRGSLRLLPTTGPTLVSDVFSDTIPYAANLSAPTIWECSRVCVDEKIVADGYDGIVHATAVLLGALGDVAIKAGIESIIGNFDAPGLRLYRRIGCEIDVIGRTSRYGKPIYLGLHHISGDIVGRIKTKYDDARSTIARLQMAVD